MATEDQDETRKSALLPLLRRLEYRQQFSAEDRAALLSLPHTVKSLEQHHYIFVSSTAPGRRA